jgi:hypothetical protein
MSAPPKGVRTKTILDGIGIFYELLMCKQEKVKVATNIKSFITFSKPNSGLHPPAMTGSRSRASINTFERSERGSDDCDSNPSVTSRNPGFIPNIGSIIKDYDAMKICSQNLWRNFSPGPELENQTHNSSNMINSNKKPDRRVSEDKSFSQLGRKSRKRLSVYTKSMRNDSFSDNNASVFLAPEGHKSTGDLEEWDDLRSLTGPKSMASINQGLLPEVPRKQSILIADGLLPMAELLNSPILRRSSVGNVGSPDCIDDPTRKRNTLDSKEDLRTRRKSDIVKPITALALKIAIIKPSPMDKDHGMGSKNTLKFSGTNSPNKIAKFPGANSPHKSAKFPSLICESENSKCTGSGKNTFDYSRSVTNQKSNRASPWNNLPGENTEISSPVPWPASGLGPGFKKRKAMLEDISSEGSESDLFESRMDGKSD